MVNVDPEHIVCFFLDLFLPLVSTLKSEIKSGPQ